MPAKIIQKRDKSASRQSSSYNNRQLRAETSHICKPRINDVDVVGNAVVCSCGNVVDNMHGNDVYDNDGFIYDDDVVDHVFMVKMLLMLMMLFTL